MADPSKTGRGGKTRLALVTWAGVYPVLTVIALALEPLLAGQPVAMRTLIMSALMVPAMVFVVMPVANRTLGQWIARANPPTEYGTPTRRID